MKAALTIAECCAPTYVRANPLRQREAEALADGFRVLADPARLRLLSMIAAEPGSEACVCDLTDPLGLSQPTVSHHLRVLHEAGLLEREQRGRWAYYRLAARPLASLRDALDAKGR